MKIVLIGILIILNTSLFASDAEISILVTLSPVGSFKIQSNKLKIKDLKKDGDTIFVKKISTKKSDLVTGIDLRDEHMRKRISDRTISVKNIKAKDGKGTGEISINKINKKINFNYTERDQTIKAKFDLNLTDFSINDIEYLGVGVKPIVDVSVNIPSP